MTLGIHLYQDNLILWSRWGHIKAQKLMNIAFSITGRPLTPSMNPKGSLKLSYFDVGEFLES
jgi:hypothetical protein